MRYALSLPSGGECADPRILAEFAQVAEAAGWDAVLLEDYITYTNDNYHSLPGHPTHDPWIALAAMATRSETIRLGTCVTPLSRWRPWHLARVTVTLDHLSGGRLILGVGLGDINDEGFTHFGEETDPRQRAELLDEGLDVLTGLWSGEPFRYDGKHYRVDGDHFSPAACATAKNPHLGRWLGRYQAGVAAGGSLRRAFARTRLLTPASGRTSRLTTSRTCAQQSSGSGRRTVPSTSSSAAGNERRIGMRNAS